MCEAEKTFTLPASQDTICFVRNGKGAKSWYEGDELCKGGGFDGMLELRNEEDANFTAKLLYCGWQHIQDKQPGTENC